MSILHRLSKEELLDYQHKGWIFGVVPVYIGDLESRGPMIAERNGIPEWWFSLFEALFGIFCWLMTLANPDFEPTFPILVTGEL